MEILLIKIKTGKLTINILIGKYVIQKGNKQTVAQNTQAYTCIFIHKYTHTHTHTHSLLADGEP